MNSLTTRVQNEYAAVSRTYAAFIVTRSQSDSRILRAASNPIAANTNGGSRESDDKMLRSATNASTKGLRVGDLVQVRSAEEIMATLDEHGELENLPFMPEMLKYCGQRLTVHKVAHKLCDTISGTGLHKMENAVHLTGSRCDGSSHGGCQTACQLYWKEAWLKPVEPGVPSPSPHGRVDLPLLEMNTRKEPGPDRETRFSCQATELLRAAPTCLPARELGQFVTDVKAA